MTTADRSGSAGTALAAIGAAAASDAGDLDPELLGDFLKQVLDAAAMQRRLRRPELARCTAAGRRAAVEGVALRALVDLYLSAAWRLWRDAPELTAGGADQVRAAGLAVLRATDDGVAALAEGFQLARADLARLQEAARHDVLDALLAGGGQAVEATGRAAELGLVLTGPVAVLVARRPEGFIGPGTAALPRRVERGLRGRHGDAQPLVLLRGGELVCVFAAPDRAALEAVRSTVTDETDSQLGRRGRDSGGGAHGARSGAWRGAVSTARTGAAAVRTSYDEARYALELADRLELSSPVVDAADLAVYRVLLQDRPAVHDLVRSTLAPLAQVRGAAQHLETLDVYYSTGCVATETAARLHLSVRAVTYRLARVADLIGRDPSAPAERFALQAAVTAARLLDWPATPLPS